ncbi:MAG: hypothetical protein N2110_03105 [Flavobacteriales bacterium]|nr:hypothetical protein [Flavobacteriales bacterium]MCX7767995.1 hypothetical protein [Flavobacteriales bacterium]MDW8409200.1 hypothetical protein [Flavobacteriales bacterium]
MKPRVSKLGFLALLGMGLGAWGCKKSTQNEEVTLILRIRLLAGSEPLVHDVSYPYQGGHVRFVNTRFYVSLPAVRNAQGDTLYFEDAYALLDELQSDFVVGKIPYGQYTHLFFGMGVDYARNTQLGPKAQPATAYPMDHPLSAVHGMYWGWNPGYIFAQCDGRFDANGNGSFTDPEDVLFSYHPGTDKLYRYIQKPVSFHAHGEKIILTLQLNILKCLESIDIVNHPTAHPVSPSDPEYPTAKSFVDAYGEAFSPVNVQ